ncbi:MAG: DNA translocase FtsK [Chloroflexi bacterium]|nr:DNA translocase FtsK [Chloroflexota bacterium]
MATRRRRQARKRGSILSSLGLPPVSPEVSRSLFGITLLVLGAVTLLAFLPGAGSATLTQWFQHTVGPWFGSLRWLLPILLLVTGWYVEWGPGKAPGSGWGLTATGVAVAYAGLLGAASVVIPAAPGHGAGGGLFGSFLARLFLPLIGDPATFVLLLAVGIVGVLLAFNLRLRDLMAPVMRILRWLGVVAAESIRREPGMPGPEDRAAGRGSAALEPDGGPRRGGVRGGGRAIAGSTGPPGGQTGIWGEDTPVPVPSSTPVSATFAPARAAGAGGNGAGLAGSAAGAAAALRPIRDPNDITDASDSPPTKERIEYVLPPPQLLDAVVEPATFGGEEVVHQRNEEIIRKKLASMDIEAQIVGRNAGPVVTQYEVQPAPHVKVSRIEALADDLAMALAARSLRIEAPIPGKAAVGIEVPNKDFNVVTLRGILESVDFSTGSRLTFALGRDVAGRAQAVDLAKMPHLLIAGATGSGKSVMVNALITSLLCHATPDDVRMILTDLKRVELAAYNGLPHLLVPVITEPDRAKAALKWAVNEMEGRYRRFAGASARNIRGYNDSRADPDDKMPYIVIVVDELADLMMREGKNVEDPIVRLAQKARATGIHMVLATQRPSVNVVTGLIKANFPSRIAFAMASQIDSRTILDTPGAEDLIGRGDMLYQPSDLPRPMRLQGVFVSDVEIGRVVDHWKGQIDDPHYDLGIIQSDEDGSGSVDDLADEDADRLLPDAVEVIREYDRASASLLQRRLKVGYARAARMIDQLEARGYIGAFDGSNARMVLRRDDGPGDNRGDPGDD